MTTTNDASSVADSNESIEEYERAWQDDPQLAFELGQLIDERCLCHISVELAFERWDVLTTAIENGWCGSVTRGVDIREEWIDATIDMFLSSTERYHWDAIVDYLHDGMAESFHLECQDGSDEHLARLLCTVHHDTIHKHNFDGVKKMMSSRKRVLLQQRAQLAEAAAQVQDDDEDGDDDNEYDESNMDDLQSGVVNTHITSSSDTVAATSSSSSSDTAISTSTRTNTTDADGWTTVPSRSREKHKK